MISSSSRCWLPLLAALFLVGCQDAQSAFPVFSDLTEHESPAGAGSSWPFLSASDDGKVYLSWLAPEDPEALASASTHRGAFRLRFSVRDEGGWSSPTTIARGERFFVNWADFPSILPLPDGTLVAHWLGSDESGSDGTDGYGFFLALSHDGGRTWSSPRAVGEDGGPRGHFPTLFPWDGEDGAFAGIWLDRPDDSEAGAEDDPSIPMTLRHAVFDAEGRVVENAVLDSSVCDCCQIGVANTARGPVAVYRGRTDEEVRDINVVRHGNGGWTEPAPVHADGWTIPACPVNGPAIAARGERVVVAWFTGAEERPRVQVAFSDDAGRTFGEPFRVDEGGPVGRVDVALLSDGTALVSWLERGAEQAEIRVRRFAPDGSTGPARTVATSSEDRVSGFPRMVLNGDELVFAWTDPGAPGMVRVAGSTAPSSSPVP